MYVNAIHGAYGIAATGVKTWYSKQLHPLVNVANEMDKSTVLVQASHDFD